MTNSKDLIPLSQAVIHLHPRDNVAIAKCELVPGTRLAILGDPGERFQVSQTIPAGHKVALVSLAKGDPILRYGQEIGKAVQAIQAGQHVHTHNLQPTRKAMTYTFSEDLGLPGGLPRDEGTRFLGYTRQDGQVGTRNYLAVIASVQCAAQVCQAVARYFTPERLSPYPQVDGVIALTSDGGCAKPDYVLLQRTIAGMARHPNVNGVVLVGLGCEGNQLSTIVKSADLIPITGVLQPVVLTIQDLGGAAKTIQAGIEAIEQMLPKANVLQRTPQPLSKLKLALECGGSDSWSGITANPLVGMVSDEVVRRGGTVVLAETPEIYGAEHLLTRRAINEQVGRQLLAKLDWWADYMSRVGASFEDNPGPGNQAGGLTNICEKSLGAIVKSGSSPLMAVYGYAEQISVPGLVFMDTPGYDPASVTGMVAGGCNLVLFTTGRGSVFGFKPAPCLKICSNSTTFQRMEADMDFNAGRLLEENISGEDLAGELLELVVATASGRETKSERLGWGELGYAPWSPVGPV